jgi:hypothetical protein
MKPHDFEHIPTAFAGLPPECLSHSSRHADLSRLKIAGVWQDQEAYALIGWSAEELAQATALGIAAIRRAELAEVD